MRLLILTQAVDANDPVLGFFVHWITELANRCEEISVICLKEGEHSLPENVQVYSLGKEDGADRVMYLRRFYSYIWKLRNQHDSVFIHMNEEYVLLGGLLWHIFGKKIYLWRNHAKGSWFTRLAVSLSTKVFCTSKHSFTARFKKAVLMPVGIDTGKFTESGTVVRNLRSILFFSRIAPVKRPEMFIDALGEVLAKGISFTASMYGSPLPQDELYYESLKARAESLGLHDRLRFHAAIPNHEAPALYQAHDIFVNCTPAGSMDKTMFEAAACGCRVIAASDDFRDAAGNETYAPDVGALIERLIQFFSADEDAVIRQRVQMEALARSESIGTLADRLVIEMS